MQLAMSTSIVFDGSSSSGGDLNLFDSGKAIYIVIWYD